MPPHPRGIGNRYLGDLAHGRDENRSQSTELAVSIGTLIAWFHRYQDVILRFAADLNVPSPPLPTPPPCSLESRSTGRLYRAIVVA